MEHPLSPNARGEVTTACNDKDQLIANLVRDKEVLVGEVQALDEMLQQTQEALAQLRDEKAALEASFTIGQHLLDTVGEQAAIERREREREWQSYEALAAQHATDKEFLNSVFGELEASLTAARAERQDTQSRADRERHAALARVRELEEGMLARGREALALRAQCDAEKAALVRQCEQCDQRVAGMRLERDQAILEKQVLAQLECDVGELRALARGARVRELTCAEQDVLELAMRRGPGGDANGLSLSSTCYVGHGAVVVAPGRGTLGRPR